MTELVIDFNILDTKPLKDLVKMLDEDSDCIDEPLRSKLIAWAEINGKADSHG